MARKTVREDDWVFTAKENSTVWENLMAKGLSRKFAGNILKDKLVWVDGKKCESRQELKGGEEIRVFMPKEKIDYEPIEMPLRILYEDHDILIVDKPCQMTVNSNQHISLANGIAHYFEENGIKRKIRFLNRLDRDTSGCIMIAKSAIAQSLYQEQLESNRLEKWYETIVDGKLTGEDILSLKMGKAEDGIHQEVREDGKMTQTKYTVIGQYKTGYIENETAKALNDFSESPEKTIVEVELLTGKTHQIRVAMAHIGHPLTGDRLYGGSLEGETFYLRSKRLVFYHMRTGEKNTILA